MTENETTPPEFEVPETLTTDESLRGMTDNVQDVLIGIWRDCEKLVIEREATPRYRFVKRARLKKEIEFVTARWYALLN